MDSDTMIYPGKISSTEYYSSIGQREHTSEADMLLNRVRLYARRRVLWLQHLWAHESDMSGQHLVTHAAVESILNNSDNITAEQDFYHQHPKARNITEDIQEIENILLSSDKYRLNRLQTCFNLNEFEKDLIHLCFAGAVDNQFNKLFAYLNDHAGQPYATRSLTEKLFGYPPADPGAVLRSSIQWKIISVQNPHPGGPAIYELDEAIISWFSGAAEPEEDIASLIIPVQSHDPLESWPVQKALHFFRSATTGHEKTLVIAGAEGSGRKTFAKYIIEHSGKKMICIDLSNSHADADHIMRVRRAALLNEQVIAWYHPDHSLLPILNENRMKQPEVIISGLDYQVTLDSNVPEVSVAIPALQIDQRKHLWQQIYPAVKTWEPAAFNRLVTGYEVTVGEIHKVAELDPQDLSQVYTQLNARNHVHLNRLAENIPADFHRSDLVVSEHVSRILDSICYEARERNAFWEDSTRKRLFPQGRGLLSLFTGPPGTGKTMAAQVLANQLRLELYRIDLSTIVSKYVGETSKNLEEVIRHAQNVNVILFFDEADALFGKRTEIGDAHDRFANTDTGFLLQAIESYDGTAILASNKKGNIDQAFIRRLRYVVEFQKPDTALRHKIWSKLLAELLTKKNYEVLHPRVGQLSRSLELTGAQIKYAILSALFLARRDRGYVTIRHLLTGIERELMKNGQGLTAQQKEMVQNA